MATVFHVAKGLHRKRATNDAKGRQCKWATTEKGDDGKGRQCKMATAEKGESAKGRQFCRPFPLSPFSAVAILRRCRGANAQIGLVHIIQYMESLAGTCTSSSIEFLKLLQ